MSRQIKQRRRMTKAQSSLVCQVYADCEADWYEVMADARIAALGYSREFLATHIANKKKRIRRHALADDAVDDDEEESSDTDPPLKREGDEPMQPGVVPKRARHDVSAQLRQLDERMARTEEALDDLRRSVTRLIYLVARTDEAVVQ